MANDKPSERERNEDSVLRRDEGGGNGPRDATRASPQTRREANEDGADKATKPLPGRAPGTQEGDHGGQDISRGG